MINFGVIGCGNMGYAILEGIYKSKTKDELNSNLSSLNLFGFDKDESRVEKFQSIFVNKCDSEIELLEKCKYIVLAMKPQQFDEVLRKISSFITNDHVIISIAAGIGADFIKERTSTNIKTVITMPNTPLMIGEGATAISRDEIITDEEFTLVCDIFSACGVIAVIDKDKMKEIIAINGSSPAFIYLFAKGFIDYAKSQNIDEDSAKNLFSQSLIGSAKMIIDGGFSVDELIKMVTSPGGTTFAGLEKFQEGKLLEVINEACTACTKRAYELSK